MRTSREITEQQSYSVIKANELIQKGRFTLTAQQQKLVLYLVSKIKPNDTGEHTYIFKIRDFCRVCGVDYEQTYYYTTIKAELKKLRDKSVWIELPNGDEVTAGWLSKAKISKATGNVYIEFDRDMVPFLFELKERYTQYCLEYVLPMRSLYAIRLYELLKSYEWQGIKKPIELEELKACIGASNYERFNDFRRWALIPAVNEINAYTDIKVDWKPIQDGRKVVSVLFEIRKISGEEINTRREKRWKVLRIDITPERAEADFSGFTPEDEVE